MRFCTPARYSSGTGSRNSTTTGIATPYSWPSTRYRPVPVRRPGSLMVVNVVSTVDSRPSAPLAVTVAVYVVSGSSGTSGTQEVPSSRIAPGTVSPSSLDRTTSVTVPAVTSVPISVLRGASRVPGWGVTASCTGAATGVGVAVGA